MASSRIKELRKAHGLSQAQLASETGLSVHSINSYESGRREPNSKAMACLERYFNVSGAYLRGETDDPSQPYWDSSLILEDLKDVDKNMLPGLLENYQSATPETQFYVREIFARISNMLNVSDPEFQRCAAFLLQHFCTIAYDYIRNYQIAADRHDGSPVDFSGVYNFHMQLLGEDLVETQRRYFPSSPDPRGGSDF
ncbi:MAG: helix-turn-helix domain-containing protein [Blautia massiliensis (ex Durand et al. 2017)]|nr:MAG: hypothetical protein DBX91_06305 [Subdoligranulum variabile]